MIGLGSSPSNLLDLDYRALASQFQALPSGILDLHCHVNGPKAARILQEVCDLYGVEKVFSMTRAVEMEAVLKVLGERIEFIGIPDYFSSDLRRAVTSEYQALLKRWRKRGMRIAKFWSPPRGRTIGARQGDPEMLRLDGACLRDTIQCAVDLGMVLMVHVADPDTWFNSVYQDSALYKTKAQHYEIFENFLARVSTPVIAAHFGGYPENLTFLSALLERHPRLYLDTSATKWAVRELSRHPREEVQRFFERWRGRLCFGSDIVTSDAHLMLGGEGLKAGDASSPEDAFDLYASRYWALRTLFETDYDGPSPIADPDLSLAEPEHHTPTSSPSLNGKALPGEILHDLYRGSAEKLLALV